MTLGNWIEAIITWGSAVLGVWALLHHARNRWGGGLQRAILQAWSVIDHYVALWQEQQINRNAGLPDTYQVEPPSVPVVRGGSEPVPNRDPRLQLIDIMAAMVDDTGKHIYSANYISEVARGTRAEVLDRVRAIRGTPAEPVEDKYPDHQFVKTGPRETYERTGVKLLRGER